MIYTEVNKKYALEIINSKNKKMKLLTKKQQKSYENTNIFYICEEEFEDDYIKAKKYRKVRNHRHYTGKYKGAAH